MKAKFPSALAILLVAASCASTPPTTTSTPNTASVVSGPTAPEWTKKTTYIDGANIVFVVAGLETADIPELAFPAMQGYLNIPTDNSASFATQAILKFLKTTSNTVPFDRYLKGGQGWWKIIVAKDSWERSRKDLLALYETAAADPSLDLEQAADELLRQGRYVDAVTGYVSAAAAVGKNAQPARFRAVLDKAQDILTKFTLSSTTPSQTTQVGMPFRSGFDVKLSFGSGPDAPLVSGAALRFSYKARTNGRVAVTGQTITTGAQGLAQFQLPTPDFASRDSVVVLVDVNPWMEALVQAPKDQRDSVAQFETIASDRKLQLPYAVESAAKQVPLIVALADFDEKGSVRGRQETTAALIAALQKAGFQTSGLPVNPALLKADKDAVVLAAWKFQGKTTGRAVYGTVSLVSVTASGSQFVAEVSGVVKVVDLATSTLVYQTRNSKIASAGDKASAATAAFRQWSSDAADALASELP